MPSKNFTALLLKKTAMANPVNPREVNKVVAEGTLEHSPEAIVVIMVPVEGKAPRWRLG